jgi:hypothetical protein
LQRAHPEQRFVSKRTHFGPLAAGFAVEASLASPLPRTPRAAGQHAELQNPSVVIATTAPLHLLSARLHVWRAEIAEGAHSPTARGYGPEQAASTLDLERRRERDLDFRYSKHPKLGWYDHT